MTGSVDKDLLKNGLLGRGVIVDVHQTNVSTGGDNAFARPVCVFTVEVHLDNVPAYTATCRQSVPLTLVPQFVPGQLPEEPNGVVIDFKAALEEFTK